MSIPHLINNDFYYDHFHKKYHPYGESFAENIVFVKEKKILHCGEKLFAFLFGNAKHLRYVCVKMKQG